MASTFLRVLSLLLVLLPTSLRDYYVPAVSKNPRPANDAVNDELHPLVLVPGMCCSELEARLTDDYRPSVPRCGAMKGKGWFGLWHNSSDLAARDYVACFMEQMSLVYDPDANDYRNVAGVETRVRNFGASTGFYSDPRHSYKSLCIHHALCYWKKLRSTVLYCCRDWCLEPLRQELDKVGYRDGETLFGAPYDWRHAPPIPGQPSRAFSRYVEQLMSLVEDISNQRKKKVILFGHSQGGMVALEFMRAAPPAWRDRYIKHLVLVAPLPISAGFVDQVWNFVSGCDLLDVPTTTALSLRPMWRTFASAILGFPSPAAFGDDVPVVITRRRNYTVREIQDLLADVGADDAVEPFMRRQLPRWSRNFEEAPPMVPVTCMNGVGIDTPEQLVYREGDFDKDPEVVYGDGDNTINLASMLAFDEEMRRHPGQRQQYKTIKLPGAEHGTIITQDWPLKRVIQEILEAGNRS